MKKSTAILIVALFTMLLVFGCGGSAELAPPATISERKSLQPANVRISAQVVEDKNFEVPCVRMYYSYLLKGKWEIVPAEHYALHSIFHEEEVTGFDAASYSHIVKIGPYLIVSICHDALTTDLTYAPCEITDTLGTQVQQPFSQYESYTPGAEQQYGFITSMSLEEGNQSLKTNHFYRRYCLVLNYEELPEDYSLQYIVQIDDRTEVHTLSYAQIQALVGGDAELPTSPKETTKQDGTKLDPDVDEITEGIVRDGRHDAAYLTPDLTGNITQIRITEVPRDFCLGPHYPVEMRDITNKFQFLQIYYGYLDNGEWCDIPSENYTLRGIFDDANLFTGFDLAGRSHITKIGNYLLICVEMGMDITAKPEFWCEIRDTLGSEVIEPFTQYYTVGTMSPKEGEEYYGLFKEDNRTFESSEGTSFEAEMSFSKYYYLILDYETLPEDYVLTVTFHEETDTTKTLDYPRIKFLIGE